MNIDVEDYIVNLIEFVEENKEERKISLFELAKLNNKIGTIDIILSNKIEFNFIFEYYTNSYDTSGSISHRIFTFKQVDNFNIKIDIEVDKHGYISDNFKYYNKILSFKVDLELYSFNAKLIKFTLYNNKDEVICRYSECRNNTNIILGTKLVKLKG